MTLPPHPVEPGPPEPDRPTSSGPATPTFDKDAFLAEPCYCGHTRQAHRRPGGVDTRQCLTCADGHYFTRPEHHERDLREAAAAADPNHRHERTHTAYACPGFIPFQVCDDCGASLLASPAQPGERE